MDSMRRLLIVLIILASLSDIVLAQQRKVRVPQGFGTLNEAIRNDTTASGERRDPNTIYVLKRGGVYVLSGTIVASGFNLFLEAEEGEGPRPFIIMGFLTGAAQVEESIKVFNQLSMKSIHLTNINEFNTYVGRIVAVDAPQVKLEFNDCLFDGSGQTFIRLNSAGSKIYMHNCTVSRMGRPSNPDNGRVIDDRGNQIDTLVVENNTWYNVTSRVIRDGGAEINYVKLNQNTFVNGGQRFAQIGQVNQLYMNNNLIVNPRYIGNSPTSDLVAFEFTAFGNSPVININYNNIYYDQAIFDVWAEVSSQQTQPVIRPPFVIPANQVYLTQATGLLEEPLTFAAGPTPPTEIIRISALGSGSSVPDWDWSGAISTNPWELNAIAYHNFTYPTTALSYSASATNEPLGDLRWFNGFDIIWNLQHLIKQAELLINQYENNPVIAVNATALLNLENQISLSKLVAENINTNRAQTATAVSALQNSINAFKASFIITQVEQPLSKSVSFFPNPAADYIYISNLYGTADRIIITNQSGQLVSQKEIKPGVDYVDVTGFNSGLYIIRFFNNNRLISIEKLIKQ